MPARVVFHDDEWTQNGYAVNHPEMVIEVGCVAKLRNPQNESFFVIVQHRHTDSQKWLGKVDNHLINGSEYNFGDLVLFGKEDVIDFKSLQQKQNQGLKLALHLMTKYLEEIGMINEDMTRSQRIEITDYFIMKYPNKLAAVIEFVNRLSDDDHDNDEGRE